MEQKRVAVLIDADNSPATKINAILGEVAKVGEAHVRRAYGDWANHHLSSWREQLQDYAILPIQQFAYTKGKNASDIAMVIDAMDLMHSGVANAYAIVSSDADFTPLVMRLRQSGATVLGFGQSKTPAAFVNACSSFVFIERLAEDSDDDPVEQTIDRKSGAEMRQDSRLVSLLRTAVDATSDDDGWAYLSAIGNHIRNQSSFEPRNVGYAKLVDLLEEIDLFEIDRTENGPLRARRKTKTRS